jgi:hypothetical protein
VEADGERLCHRSKAWIDALGHDVALAFSGDDHFLKRALHVGKAHGAAKEPHIEAVELLSLEAVRARVAGARGRERNAITDLYARYARAKAFDDACNFMAECHGLAHADRADAAVVVVVKVRAAYAAALDFHADFAGAGATDFALINAKVMSSVDDDGVHGASFLLSVRRV